ncbi:MAG: mannose-1-phosphate guanylyltransferase [Candidatus Cloacimonadaceae bacterium]|nr:mannose-1-phosphate guanylyltransferase [Candidatus Cloacimonadaceae bacterium]
MIALIMAGGAGTRFWPQSRNKLPKQFLRVMGDKSMIQLTLERLTPLIPVEDIYVVTAASQVSLVQEHLPELPLDNIIIEPFGMNTAPCIALSAAHLTGKYPPEECMIVLPADHIIRDTPAFLESLVQAEKVAREGYLVTFGIIPEYPATGYGYIEAGEELSPGVHRVAHFKEKPDYMTAEHFLSRGNFYWNSGMFCWTIQSIVAAFEIHLPAALTAANSICKLQESGAAEDEIATTYARMPKTPIDIGIMEPAQARAVIPVNYGWSDVGSWKALSDISAADENGNSFLGEGLAIDSKDNYIYSHKFVALIGVENLCLVETDDAILISSKEDSEQVKNIVDTLKSKHKDHLL